MSFKKLAVFLLCLCILRTVINGDSLPETQAKAVEPAPLILINQQNTPHCLANNLTDIVNVGKQYQPRFPELTYPQFVYLITAIVAHESKGNDEIVSPSGAVGAMQVMPATAADSSSRVLGYVPDAATMQEWLRNSALNTLFGIENLVWTRDTVIGLLKQRPDLPQPPTDVLIVIVTAAHNSGPTGAVRGLTPSYIAEIRTQGYANTWPGETKAFIQSVMGYYNDLQITAGNSPLLKAVERHPWCEQDN